MSYRLVEFVEREFNLYALDLTDCELSRFLHLGFLVKQELRLCTLLCPVITVLFINAHKVFDEMSDWQFCRS